MNGQDVPALPKLSPIIGVGAVVWNEQNEIALIRRRLAPRAGEWSIPGGKLEWGETAKEGVLREVYEETGLVVEIAGLIDVVDSITRDEEGNVIRHYVLIDFVARRLSGELHAGSDAAEARWVPYVRLNEYTLWTETRRIIETAQRMRG